jgi:hypothetical protein
MLARSHRLAAPLTAASLLAATLASGGCIAHGKYKPLAYAGDAAMIVAGGVMLRTTLNTCPNPTNDPADMCAQPDHSIATTKLIGGTLLALGAVGLAFQIGGDVQPSTVEPLPSEPSRDVDNSDDVKELTANARDAAKAGACADVINLARRVEVLDPPYYRHVWMSDEDIRGCL